MVGGNLEGETRRRNAIGVWWHDRLQIVNEGRAYDARRPTNDARVVVMRRGSMRPVVGRGQERPRKQSRAVARGGLGATSRVHMAACVRMSEHMPMLAGMHMAERDPDLRDQRQQREVP